MTYTFFSLVSIYAWQTSAGSQLLLFLTFLIKSFSSFFRTLYIIYIDKNDLHYLIFILHRNIQRKSRSMFSLKTNTHQLSYREIEKNRHTHTFIHQQVSFFYSTGNPTSFLSSEEEREKYPYDTLGNLKCLF